MHPAGDIAGVGVVTSAGSPTRLHGQPWSRTTGPMGSSGAMSPRVRGPQRMVSASATLGGGCIDRLADRFGDQQAFSPAPVPGQGSRSARVAAPTGGNSVAAASGTSAATGSSNHGAHSPPARSSFGVRASNNSIGANRRNKSVERGLSPGVPATRQAPQGSVTLATADGLSHSYAVVAEGVEAEDAYLTRIQPHPSSASRPHLWVPTSATPPAASSVYIPRSCWTHLDTYRPVPQSGYLASSVPQPPSGYLNRPTSLEVAQQAGLQPSSLQGLGSSKMAGIAVQGLSGAGLSGAGLRSQVAPPSSQWPRAGAGYAGGYGGCSPRMGLEISGALTPAQPPPSFASAASTPASAAAMMRSASDLPGGARFPVAGGPGTPQPTGSCSGSAVTPGSSIPEPRDLRVASESIISRMPRHCQNLDDSNISGSTVDSVSRQSSKANGPQVASMSLVPEMEQEFLRRIEVLEQKVVDRDGLLAKLTHQQARLDRLESLARENEMLKAQMRDDLRRRPVTERGTSKDAARRASSGKSSMAGGGQNRSDNSRTDSSHNRNDSVGREALLPREVLSARRMVSPPAAETPDKGVEPCSPNGSRTSLSVGVSQVHRCSSSGLVSPPPATDRVDRPPPRRMMSAPMDYVPPQYETAKVVTASDLESRLEELEQALGLQPGVNGKCNGVMRERSI